MGGLNRKMKRSRPFRESREESRDAAIGEMAKMLVDHDNLLRELLRQLVAKGVVQFDKRTEGGVIVPGGPGS